ncbi:MAG TPA: hypothetical protein VEK82_17680 [Stellaceae bacterium]|nr:hypothetical protein [Stellaceae bacterium]
MSDASPGRELGPPRPLRAKELAIVRKLLSASPMADKAFSGLAEAFVQEMPDGGMGSVQFCGASADPDRRRFGKQVAEGAFRDADGVPVSVTLNVDQRGELFELDVFKADFSPLTRYPEPEDLEIVERHGQVGFPPQAS